MTTDMTQGNPTKLLLAFSIPMLIGNIFQQLYSMVDTIVVGRFIGVEALAAVGVTGGLSFLILGFIMGLTNGFAVIVSQRFGAGDTEGLRRNVAISVYLSVGIIIVLTIISLLMTRPLLTFMNTPGDIMEGACTYISIIFAGIIVTVFYNLIAAVLRALGDSKTPLYFLIIASVINIILDLVFVIVFKMGVAGVGYATVISQAVSCVLCLVYSRKRFPILQFQKKDWIWSPVLAKNLLKIGVPTALQSSVTAIGVIILQGAINNFGSTIVAAFTAANKVEQLATQPGFTFGMTMATYTAQNLGANKLDRIHTGIRKCIKLSMIFNVVGTLVVIVLGRQLITLFVSPSETEVIYVAKEYLNLVSIFFFMLGLLFIYRNALQGIGNAFIPMMSGVVELMMRVAAAILLSVQFGFIGICWANPIAWIGATILLIAAFYKNMKKLDANTQNEVIHESLC